MNCHLVTVKVGIKSSTNERMQLDSLAFNQFRLESLDTEPVQGGCTVQHHRMPFKYILKNIPNDRIFPVDDFLGRFYGFHNPSLNQFPDDKRFVKFSCHIFG